MERTLEPEQYVLVDKLTPRFDTYKRGRHRGLQAARRLGARPTDTPFIKRVIGVGGDTVEIRDDGLVYINDTALDEPYLYAEPDGGPPQPTTAARTSHAGRCPTGELFLMGDHRSNSADSRTFGPVPVEQVIGRAWLRYWPLDTFGILPTPTYPDAGPGRAMNPALAGVALAVTVGAVVAVSARDARTAVLGLAVVARRDPVLADPAGRHAGPRRPARRRDPGRVPPVDRRRATGRCADRRVAPRLAGRASWPRRRRSSATARTGSGPPASGPALAQARRVRPGGPGGRAARRPAGTSSGSGSGLLLLMDGALLVRVGLGGTPATLEQLVTAGLIVGLGGAIAVLAFAARAGRRRRLRAARLPRSRRAADRPRADARARRAGGDASRSSCAVTVRARPALALLLRRAPASPRAVVGLVALAARRARGRSRSTRRARDRSAGRPSPTTEYLRLFLVLGSLVGLSSRSSAWRRGSRRDAPAVTLGMLGAAALALALPDPRIAVLRDHRRRAARRSC